ncbi:hypothetical protein [Clostridium tunisiense]|nr:hypothetical protein [Clostridium tunisiense]
MKKIKRLSAILLGVTVICMGLTVTQQLKRSDDPDLQGRSVIVHMA